MLGAMVTVLMSYFHWCLILGCGVVAISLIATFIICNRYDNRKN